ncbi:hypothetical protein BDZ97DRAFT_1682545 [Flammula alnicola]|nr:hypothetical protein BDZ97DRAFT_1682545 [Flammula alnicola]
MSDQPFCRGKQDNREDCDCEEFSNPIQPSPDQPLRCAECLHGRSKHPKQAQSQPVSKSTHPSTPASGATAAGKQSVLDIFKNRVESGQSKAMVPAQKPKGALIDDRPLSKVLLAEMESRGCAKQNVTINTDWTHEECTTQLTKLIPRPFKFAARRTDESKGSGKERRSQRTAAANSMKPTWVLISRDGRKLAVVEKEKATGSDLWFYRCGEKSGKQNVNVIVGGYLPVTFVPIT